MIPDYQSLMRPVLAKAAEGEIRIGDLIWILADQLGLSDDERAEMLPSGSQTVFANRVHWAKTYLKQAGLVEPTKRAHFVITDLGRQALKEMPERIDNSYLRKFESFNRFQGRSAIDNEAVTVPADSATTPDETLRQAHEELTQALIEELLSKVREMPPAFFESLIVQLLLAMGYGGTGSDAGRALGRSGDDGIDGVIDQDPLGVDQVYIQAKRYADGNAVGSGAIRDFFGGLSLRRANKGIFVTTSQFTKSAAETAANLGTRIVLIDGVRLARLMIRYNIGCRVLETYQLKSLDEDFFG